MRFLQARLPPAAWQGAPDLAHVAWTRDGRIREQFYEHRVRSRLDGPALREWDAHGHLLLEQWWRGGRAFREEGPAVRTFYPNGEPRREEWWQNVRHRRGGPAVTNFAMGGRVTRREYYLNGHAVTREQATAAPEVIEGRMWTARRTQRAAGATTKAQ
jgi:hypothetical protein